MSGSGFLLVGRLLVVRLGRRLLLVGRLLCRRAWLPVSSRRPASSPCRRAFPAISARRTDLRRPPASSSVGFLALVGGLFRLGLFLGFFSGFGSVANGSSSSDSSAGAALADFLPALPALWDFFAGLRRLSRRGKWVFLLILGCRRRHNLLARRRGLLGLLAQDPRLLPLNRLIARLAELFRRLRGRPCGPRRGTSPTPSATGPARAPTPCPRRRSG